MTSPLLTLEPSLTLRTASRPGIFAETAAFVRATTYPFATTATDPLAPPPAPAPPVVVETVTTWTGTVPPRRPITTTTAMTSAAAAVSHSTRPSARLTAGGGSSRLIRSLERAAACGAVTPRQAQAADSGEYPRTCAATASLSPARRFRRAPAPPGGARTAARAGRRSPSRPARAPASRAPAAPRPGDRARHAAR